MILIIGMWKEIVRGLGFQELQDDESWYLLGVKGTDDIIKEEEYILRKALKCNKESIGEEFILSKDKVSLYNRVQLIEI